MGHQNAIPRGIGVGGMLSGLRAAVASKGRRIVAAGLAMLMALVAGPVAAQATTVTITGANRPSFSRAGQPVTFYVQLDTGNTGISSLTFTSGSPSGASGLSCPGLPADVGATTTCTFTYTTTATDVAMGKVTVLGRWRATRPTGAARSGATNTMTFGFTAPRQPDSPASVSATAVDGQATIAFAEPYDGGHPVDSYTVMSDVGGFSATGSGSPITVTGLSNGTTYTFSVRATSIMGTSASSAPSNAVTPQAAQAITFANPGMQTFGTTPTLTASADSGLVVSFTSSTTGVCTVTSGGALTFVSAGTCTINANQAGNAAFLAAPQVSQSFLVNAIAPGAPTIGTASAGNAQATVTFTAPASTGGAPISLYTVTANPGGATASGTVSGITVPNLTNGVAYTFTVAARNSAGTGSPSAASNTVTPRSAPTVGAVNVPSDGLYGPGQSLDFTVTWDQAVEVTGTPGIALTIGATVVQAQYVAGSGSALTLFRHVVAAGQFDADGVQVSGLARNGGTLRNANGTDAVLTLNSVGPTTGVLVGTNNQAPVNTVPGAQSVDQDDVLALYGVSISDADAGSGDVEVALNASNGTLTLGSLGGLSFSSGDGIGDADMVFRGRLSDINVALVGLRFTPNAGYFGSASVRISTDDLGNSGVDGRKTDTDTVAITVVSLDSTAPMVTSIDRVDASPTKATTVRYRVTFSEPVAGFGLNALTLVGTGTATGSLAIHSTTDNTQFVVTITGVGGSGTLRLDFANGIGVRDASGNLAPAFNGGQAYAIDNTAPRVTAVTTPASGQYIAGTAMVFVLAFDEAVTVTGAPTVPITLDVGGTRQATYLSGSGSTALSFTYTVVAGDRDLDGFAMGSAFAPNGGAIADATGTDADTTLRGVGSTSGVIVGQLAQTITAFVANPVAPTFVVGGTFAVSASGGTSGNAVVFASTTAAVCSVAGSTVTMLSAGTCSLTANQAGNTYYTAAAQATLDVAIGTGTQAITGFTATPVAPVYSAGGTFTVSATPGVSTSPEVFGSATASVCTVSGNTVTMLSAGTCSLTADQAGDANYSAATQLALDVTIGAASQLITGFVANPAAPVYARGGTFALSANGGASGNPVVFASTTASVCTVAGSTVTMLAAGSCALTADQAGNASYTAAPQVALQVEIGRATPTLRWVEDMTRVVGEADFDLTDPNSDSAGALTFTSSNTAVATVSGRRVTIVGAGVTTLVATQAASGNYAQGSVSITLTVTARPDPTRDASVVGGLQAQVDASVRFAAAQQTNIQSRLRQQRHASTNTSSNGLTLNLGSRSGMGLSLAANQFASFDNAGLPAGVGVWTAGTISNGARDREDGSSASDFRSDGVTVGADWRVDERLVFGVAGGWGWNDTELDEARSTLDARQRALSVYGMWRPSAQWFVDGVVGWGSLDFDIRRYSAVADATATAQRDGDQVFGALTGGYEHTSGSGATLAGYGRFDASRTRLDAYREDGLGLYDLGYGAQTVDNSGASLGVEGAFPILTDRGNVFRPYWMLEYRDTLDNRSDVELNYVVMPIDDGYVLGMRGYGDHALTYGGGLDMDLSGGWRLSLLARREHADGQRPTSSFGLMLTFAPAAGGITATALRDFDSIASEPEVRDASAQAAR